MEVQFTFFDILLTIGVAQGFFLAFILLFIRKGNGKANLFLALFILSFTLLTIGDIIYESHLLLKFPHLYLVFDPLLFVLAPINYFYVKTLTNKNWKFGSHQIIHFIPAALLYVLFSIVYLSDSSTKTKMIIESYGEADSSADFFIIICAVQIFIYLLLNLKLIRNNSKNVKNYYSYQDNVNLKWLKNFLIISFVLWIIFLVSSLLNIKELVNISNLLFTITVYLIGYYGIKQPEIFFFDEVLPEQNVKTVPAKKKYASSTLTDLQAKEYADNLVEMIQKEKIYLSNDLKLIDLAEKINLPAHHLSQLINETFQKNFNDFINDFRIEEFKKKLVDGRYSNYTILAVGLDCGFNSKAAMNSVFKDHTGITPSEYRKQYLTK